MLACKNRFKRSSQPECWENTFWRWLCAVCSVLVASGTTQEDGRAEICIAGNKSPGFRAGNSEDGPCVSPQGKANSVLTLAIWRQTGKSQDIEENQPPASQCFPSPCFLSTPFPTAILLQIYICKFRAALSKQDHFEMAK